MSRRYGSTSPSPDDDEVPLDHYDAGFGEDDPLAGGRRRKNKGSGSSSSPLASCCRTLSSLLLLPLVLLTGSSVYYTYRLSVHLSDISSELDGARSGIVRLGTEVDGQRAALSAMNGTLAEHAAVIARFADSVSNSDVLERLDELEGESLERAERLEREMNRTQTEIRTVLSETKVDIDNTVSDATNRINSQVELVQSNLSQYIRATQDQFSTENSFMVYQLAGTFTLIGCLISMWHMTSHLRNFKQPFVQRKVLAILWMCPIYSITSWLSLVLPGLEGYLAILKDLYEAYVIYQFLSFCIAVLGRGDRSAVVDLLAQHGDHLSPPVKCPTFCRKKRTVGEDERHALAEDVLMQCQVCAMQFVFLRPVLTAALFVLKRLDYHGPLFGPGSPFDHSDGDVVVEEYPGQGGMLDYRSPQFYLVVLQNVSIFLAFSGLLAFYHAVQEDLEWCRPFPKFLCIKGVVFMTFWQGMALALLANGTDILSSGGEATTTGDGDEEDQVDQYAKQAQNFLICLEMLGFAIAHFYCFPVEEWEDGYRPVEAKGKFGDNMALGDFLHDLKLIMRRKGKKDKTSQNIKSEDSLTLLEEDEEAGRGGSDEGGGLRVQKSLDASVDSGPDAEAVTPSTIQASLEAMNAPAELKEATALLMQSALLDESTARLLASDILEEPLDTSDEARQGADGANTKSDSIPGDCHIGVADTTQEDEEEDGPPSEGSSLLTSSKNEALLKPSIFTMHK